MIFLYAYWRKYNFLMKCFVEKELFDDATNDYLEFFDNYFVQHKIILADKVPRFTSFVFD